MTSDALKFNWLCCSYGSCTDNTNRFKEKFWVGVALASTLTSKLLSIPCISLLDTVWKGASLPFASSSTITQHKFTAKKKLVASVEGLVCERCLRDDPSRIDLITFKCFREDLRSNELRVTVEWVASNNRLEWLKSNGSGTPRAFICHATNKGVTGLPNMESAININNYKRWGSPITATSVVTRYVPASLHTHESLAAGCGASAGPLDCSEPAGTCRGGGWG